MRRSGKIGGSTGCNTYSIAYELPTGRNGSDELDLGKPTVTEINCSYPAGVMDMERRYLSYLEDVTSYPILKVNGELQLRTPDGRALVFSAAE